MAAAQSLDRAVLFTHVALALTKVHYVVEVDRTVLKESRREIPVRRLACTSACKPSPIVCLASSRPAASLPTAQIPVTKEAPSAFLATNTLIESVWYQIQPKYANRSRLVPGIVADRSPSQGGRSRLQSTSFEFSFISFFPTSSSSPRVSLDHSNYAYGAQLCIGHTK
jgi:hypothetical protein